MKVRAIKSLKTIIILVYFLKNFQEFQKRLDPCIIQIFGILNTAVRNNKPIKITLFYLTVEGKGT